MFKLNLVFQVYTKQFINKWIV